MYHFMILLSIVSIALGSIKCPPGWILSNNHCYSELQEDVPILDAFKHCESMDPPAYVMVLNTKQEMFDIIRDGVAEDGDYLMLGMYSPDNGTTWIYADGSTDSYIESLPFRDTSLGLGNHMECYVYDDQDASCYFYSVNDDEDFICERSADAIPEPCEVNLHKKLRPDATRKIMLKNDEVKACYLEVQGRSFKPGQVKIYDYEFATDSSMCDTGFYIQTSGDAIENEPIKPEMLTCGKKSGHGKSLMKKRSERGGIVRVYFVMNGKGGKVGIRAKARSFT